VSAPKQHKLDMNSMSVETEFVRRLMQEEETGDCESGSWRARARARARRNSEKRIAIDREGERADPLSSRHFRIAARPTDQSFFEYLKALSPSATDLELRSLLSLAHLGRFLHGLARRLASHRDFEAVQTLLAVFLRIHGDVLVANYELRDGLLAVRETQRAEAERLQNLTHYALGTLAFLRSTPVA
jgi:hypothetical protein